MPHRWRSPALISSIFRYTSSLCRSLSLFLSFFLSLFIFPVAAVLHFHLIFRFSPRPSEGRVFWRPVRPAVGGGGGFCGFAPIFVALPPPPPLPPLSLFDVCWNIGRFHGGHFHCCYLKSRRLVIAARFHPALREPPINSID